MKAFFLITLSIFPSLALAAGDAPSSRLEMLEDVDFGFFVSSPKARWGADPFERMPGFSPAIPDSTEKYRLTGIVYTDDAPIATINGKNLRIGDPIGMRVVDEIGENYVILKQGGSEIELVLPTAAQDWERENRSIAGKESR